jgi:mono/diheme cytochrome c family protein
MRFVQGPLVYVLSAVAVAAMAVRVAGRQGSGSDDFAELAAEGQMVFGTSCVSCHDAEGGEGSAPALSGHPSMGARDHVVRQILRGNLDKGMPAFATTLSDRQVAAVATYIRNAWDNAHGVVVEADVKKVRDEAKGK